MGFWHTGYMDFHEPTGFEPPFFPLPRVYRCPTCSEVFTAEEEFRRHRFEAHPLARPMLTVGGMELGDTEFVITVPLHARDIGTANASWARVNGKEVGIPELPRVLTEHNGPTIMVRLGNDDLSSEFRLRVEIANDHDLEGVDRAFREMADGRRLDGRAIEQFIRQVDTFRTARRYADGICDYLYGVLSKEEAAGLTIGYDAHREKFNRASNTLGPYVRPLSSMIQGLVALNFNQFPEAVALGRESRVASAASRYVCWLDGKPEKRDRVVTAMRNHLDTYLSDRDTEQFLRLASVPISALAKRTDGIEETIRSDISDLDRVKLRVLIGQAYLASGRTSDALRHAREVRNTPGFARWAARVAEAADSSEGSSSS